ncbi:MAG TPA: methylisocitrate lyase [Actinomycetota bacterium]|nr:methylisocitrate lyase [Actinomycetota bacterium]
MTWLTPDPGEHPAKRLRALLGEGRALVAPGVFNGLTALLAKEAGAEALYLSGAAFAASMGMPDVGLVTLDELARAARQIVRVTRVPLIVDADTGFGSALNVMRTVRELEGARCAGVQLEDQVDPKRCGHLEGTQVVETEVFAERVRAARTSRQHLIVIARTDARATLGFDEAVRRGLAYREAGADVIFPEALRSEDEFLAFARAVPGPLLANMTEFGRSPNLSAARLGELGYRIVIFPVSAARVAAEQVRRFYADLLREGTQAGWLDRMLTREDLYALIGYDGYAELDRRLARGGPETLGPDD